MKPYHLCALILLTACSDNKTEGSLHYRFTADLDQKTLINELYKPCPGDSYCQTLLLRKGAKIPRFPVSNLNDIIGIYIYDKSRFAPLVSSFNCDYRSRAGMDCLTVEELNEWISPYLK